MTTPTNQLQPGTDFDRLMTLQEVARLLRISKWTLYRLINDGELPTITIGRRRLVAPRDYMALVERLREERRYAR